jgi:hypothetical protein
MADRQKEGGNDAPLKEIVVLIWTDHERVFNPAAAHHGEDRRRTDKRAGIYFL